MKVLVVGSNGFLGRNLAKKCIQEGWDVTCSYHRKSEHIPSQCQVLHISEVLKQSKPYDVVFLLAAFIPYRDPAKADKRLIDTNVKLPMKVIEKFKKSKIVFSSSVSVYGEHKSVIFESSSYNNPSTYGLSKLIGEFLLRFHPNYQIFRFSSLYGKGMYKGTFLSRAIQQAKNDKTITLYGDGSRLQDYLYIDDAVGYCLASLKREESGLYLGVNGRSYSNTEVARTIQKFIPECKLKYTGVDKSPSFIYDNSLTKRLLRFNPKFTLEEGIRAMLSND